MAKFIVNVYNESDKGIVGAEVYITDEDGKVQSVEIVDAEGLRALEEKLEAIDETYVTWDGYWQYLEHNTTNHIIDAQTLDGLTAEELLGNVKIPEGHKVIDSYGSDSHVDGLSARLGTELNQRLSKLELGSSGGSGGSSGGTAGGGWASQSDVKALEERIHSLETHSSETDSKIGVLGKMASRFDIIRDKGINGGIGGYGYCTLELQKGGGQATNLRMVYPYWTESKEVLKADVNLIGREVAWMVGDQIYTGDKFEDPHFSKGITVTNPAGNYLAVAVIKGDDTYEVGEGIPYGFAVKPITIKGG